jgi:hypothetical protein
MAKMKEGTSFVMGKVNDETVLKTLPRRLEEALVETEPKTMLVYLTF